MGESIIAAKLKVALAALCVVFIVATAGSIVYYNYVLSDRGTQISALNAQVASLTNQVKQLNETVNELNAEIGPKNAQISNLNSQIASLNSQIDALNQQIANVTSQEENKPNIVVQNLSVQDQRSTSSNSLSISCRLVNTGGSTAYGAYLHVVAINTEGTAIDDQHSFGGLTPNVGLLLDYSINYTGSPIQTWSVTPIWTGGAGETTHPNGTFT
jgi:uncharacterized protein YoxC